MYMVDYIVDKQYTYTQYYVMYMIDYITKRKNMQVVNIIVVFTIEINQNEPRDSFTYALNYQFSFRGNDVFELYNAPQFSNISEYFSNADLQAYGLSNPDTYAGVEYVDMIIWNMNYDNGEDD